MAKINKIAIIPARGGSKRIPRKNIKNFYGKPIIAYSIEAALKSGVFDEVMVSTDDDEIAEISKKYGAAVPFFRSPELSTDMVNTAQVLIDVLNEYKNNGSNFDYVCCIYATAPFITYKRIKDGMNLLISKQVDCVLPIVKFSYPPQRGLVYRDSLVKMLYPDNYDARSQDLEPIYHDAGQFYCLKVSSLMNERKLYCRLTLPMELPENEVQDIDTLNDWKIAEIKYKNI